MRCPCSGGHSWTSDAPVAAELVPWLGRLRGKSIRAGSRIPAQVTTTVPHILVGIPAFATHVPLAVMWACRLQKYLNVPVLLNVKLVLEPAATNVFFDHGPR